MPLSPRRSAGVSDGSGLRHPTGRPRYSSRIEPRNRNAFEPAYWQRRFGGAGGTATGLRNDQAASPDNPGTDQLPDLNALRTLPRGRRRMHNNRTGEHGDKFFVKKSTATPYLLTKGRWGVLFPLALSSRPANRAQQEPHCCSRGEIDSAAAGMTR